MKIIKLGGDKFEYRGIQFRLNSNVPTGYWGRYRLDFFGERRTFTYRRDVIAYIDCVKDEK